MRNISFLFLILLYTGAYAQPTLTAATNNPAAGENYTAYVCNTAGVAQGAAGAAATWDFHTLTSTNTLTYDFVSCASTPYCDSFPGSNLAAKISVGGTINYEYCLANTTDLEILGYYYTGSGYQYYYRPERLFVYPVAYMSSYTDTNISHSSGTVNYTAERDSTIVDGYGTLMLPSGTFTNVLRLHNIAVYYDSVSGGGVSSSGYEEYSWFAAGYRFALLDIKLDTSSGSVLHVSDVIYSTGATTGIAEINNNELLPEISPNPASDVLHIKFTSKRQENIIITLSDITGKIVSNIPAAISAGANDIQCPVANLPEGLYLLHLADDANSITKKVVVTHF